VYVSLYLVFKVYIYIYIYNFQLRYKIYPHFFHCLFMRHIVVGYFSDLQIGFGCTKHKQENIFPQYQCRGNDSQLVLQQE